MLKKNSSEYFFSVENNGTIIPEDEQSKIFSKFFRTSNANRVKEAGTGLGLFIVKMICENFGWAVSFESPGKEGTGAIFYVSIPTVKR